MAARARDPPLREALRPVGLRATQVSLSPRSRSGRDVDPLAGGGGRHGSIHADPQPGAARARRPLVVGGEGWRRSRTLAITAKGRSRLQRALPLWEKAQARLKRELGARRWDGIQTSLDHVLRKTTDGGPQ
jgi:hypothetical protein